MCVPQSSVGDRLCCATMHVGARALYLLSCLPLPELVYSAFVAVIEIPIVVAWAICRSWEIGERACVCTECREQKNTVRQGRGKNMEERIIVKTVQHNIPVIFWQS